MALASVRVDWGAFGQVFVVSFGAAVGVMVLFAVGVVLLARPVPAQPSGGVPPQRAAAGLCFLACAAVVAYGLFLIVN